MAVPPITLTAISSRVPSREDAPLLVLGPALGTVSAEVWSLVIPLLADRWRIATWDLPGQGGTPVATDAFTMAEVADAVAPAIREVAPDRPVGYAGVSFGGAIGIALALRHPELLAGLVGVSTTPRIATPETWIERAALVRASGTPALVEPARARWFTPASQESHAAAIETVLAGLRGADAESYARCCEALRDLDLRSEVAAIAVPLLAVWAEHDAVAPREQVEAFAAASRDGRVVGVMESAHLSPIDQPERLAELIDGFLGGLPGLASTEPGERT